MYIYISTENYILSIVCNAAEENLTMVTPLAPFEMACRPNIDPPAAANRQYKCQTT